MKKNFTLLCMCFASVFAANAQKNLFDAADVDADGWLWLDTQAKIDKYVSMANNEDGKIDPNGKLIQMVSADFGDYQDCEASATAKGAGTDGNLEGPDAKTGYIMIPANSGLTQPNGGSIVVRMPSCSSFSIYLSSEASIRLKLWGATDETKAFNDYGQDEVMNAKFAGFSALSNAGQYTWTGMETLNNGYDGAKNLTQLLPAIVRVHNFRTYPLYVHGIKAITKEATALSTVTSDAQLDLNYANRLLTMNQAAEVAVYTTTGALVLTAHTSSVDLSTLAQGVYVVKAQADKAQQSLKICVR